MPKNLISKIVILSLQPLFCCTLYRNCIILQKFYSFFVVINLIVSHICKHNSISIGPEWLNYALIGSQLKRSHIRLALPSPTGVALANNERVPLLARTLASALAATIGEMKSALQGRMQKEQRFK